MTRLVITLAALAIAAPIGGYQCAELRPGPSLPPALAPDLSVIPEVWRNMIADAAAGAGVPALVLAGLARAESNYTAVPRRRMGGAARGGLGVRGEG